MPPPKSEVRDRCDDDAPAAMRINSILGAMRPIVIVTAPCVGGIISDRSGWRAVFYLMAVGTPDHRTRQDCAVVPISLHWVFFFVETEAWAGLNLVLAFFLLPETLQKALNHVVCLSLCVKLLALSS